jgi:hypothetical protein
VNESGFDVTVISSAEQEQQKCSNESEHTQSLPGHARWEPHDIRQKRISTGYGPVEIEYRQYCQAARPGAASCRSTYCRIPP